MFSLVNRQCKDIAPIFPLLLPPTTIMASLVVAFLALFLFGMAYAESPMVLGGFGGVKPANAEVQKVVDAIAGAIRTKANLGSDAKLTARQYISQTVAGTNYVVEVQAGGGRSAKVIHAKISADQRGKIFLLRDVKTAVIGQALKSF